MELEWGIEGPANEVGGGVRGGCPLCMSWATHLVQNDEQRRQLKIALADVAQWIGHQPANRRVAGSITSQGPYLGCGPGPQ